MGAVLGVFTCTSPSVHLAATRCCLPGSSLAVQRFRPLGLTPRPRDGAPARQRQTLSGCLSASSPFGPGGGLDDLALFPAADHAVGSQILGHLSDVAHELAGSPRVGLLVDQIADGAAVSRVTVGHALSTLPTTTVGRWSLAEQAEVDRVSTGGSWSETLWPSLRSSRSK